jgi:hypothetical protein
MGAKSKQQRMLISSIQNRRSSRSRSCNTCNESNESPGKTKPTSKPVSAKMMDEDAN